MLLKRASRGLSHQTINTRRQTLQHGTLSTLILFTVKREQNCVPEIYPIQNLQQKVEGGVHVASQRTFHRVPAGSGSGGVRHVVRTVQKTPKKPAGLQLRQQRTRHLPWFDCSHVSDCPRHFIAQLSSHSSPSFCFTSLRLKCFHTFLSLCSVFNRCR